MTKWGVAILLVLASTFCVGWLDQPKYYNKTTVTHIVTGRDTVWNICEDYMEQQNRYRTLNEFVWYVRKDNNLFKSKFIYPGQEIKINLYKRKGVLECLANL